MNWPKIVKPNDKVGRSKEDCVELVVNDKEDDSPKKTCIQKWVALIISIVILGIVFACLLYMLISRPPRVTTPLGDIEGSYQFSIGGRRYESYMGLPYALPPIGQRRFEPPEPVLPWKGVLIATKWRSCCMQYGPMPLKKLAMQGMTDSEDCLFLNVYAPDRRNHKKDLYPVIFFLHGGAFRSGSAKAYGAQYLLDKDVVLVTPNYRLGPLGFLSTEDEIVPGNMGLKDQVLALRWVQQNIRSFGGDPRSVTIVGHSAGGVSVHLHYLSKATVGLFHRGISLSGTALESWGQAKSALSKTKKLATEVGCSADTVREMVDCMKTKNASVINGASKYFTVWEYNPYSPFGPVVEKGGSEFTFLDRHPIDVITAGDSKKLPWITGVVSQEGLFPGALFLEKNDKLTELNNLWDQLAPELLDYNFTVPSWNQQNVNQLIRKHYFGRKPISHLTVRRIIEMIGDRLYAYNAAIAARLQARFTQSPVRFYYFSYRGKYSFSDMFIPSKKDYGVSHGDDLAYVLKSFFNATETLDDMRMHDTLINFWVSFAAEGKPNMGVKWPKVKPEKSELDFLHIGGPVELDTEASKDFGQTKFWLNLPINENILQENIDISGLPLVYPSEKTPEPTLVYPSKKTPEPTWVGPSERKPERTWVDRNQREPEQSWVDRNQREPEQSWVDRNQREPEQSWVDRNQREPEQSWVYPN